jgi:hypothetical protein
MGGKRDNHLDQQGFMANKDTNQAVAIQRFWDAFKACLEENRVRPDRSDFYVKWAQAFVDFRPEKALGV